MFVFSFHNNSCSTTSQRDTVQYLIIPLHLSDDFIKYDVVLQIKQLSEEEKNYYAIDRKWNSSCFDNMFKLCNDNKKC